MLKIFAIVVFALGVNARQELGDSLMSFLPKFKSPAEVGQMVKEWKQGGKEDGKLSKDERATLQREQAIQKQEAALRRREQYKADTLALQERIDAAKRQRYEQRENAGQYVAPRQCDRDMPEDVVYLRSKWLGSRRVPFESNRHGRGGSKGKFDQCQRRGDLRKPRLEVGDSLLPSQSLRYASPFRQYI